MIVLVSDLDTIPKYVRLVPATLPQIVSSLNRPTTIIYDEGINLAKNILNSDGSVAIRIIDDTFCKSLITRFGTPIVSTSANVSGESTPMNFKDIDEVIKNGIDYIVKHRQDELDSGQPSSIIKIRRDGKQEIIR